MAEGAELDLYADDIGDEFSQVSSSATLSRQ